MRVHRVTLTLLAAWLVAAAAPLAAEPTRLVVPLSDPGKPAELQASLVMGSLHVVAGKPGEVVIEAASADEDDDEETCEDCPVIAGKPSERHRHDRSSMHRIPNRSLDVTAEEEHNRVRIGTNSFQRAVELRVSVPPASSLKLSTVNDGELVVEGIQGELDLHNTNGDIRVTDARGPVNANTVNGDVTVEFTRGFTAAPMAFSTLNGDVDLTLPSGVKLDVRLRSDNGEIYSDFDVALSPNEAKVETDRAKGKYRVSVAKELTGKIGGGGPELFLKTFNGDILLRRGPGG